MLVLNPSFDEITEELDDMDGWMDGRTDDIYLLLHDY